MHGWLSLKKVSHSIYKIVETDSINDSQDGSWINVTKSH